MDGQTGNEALEEDEPCDLADESESHRDDAELDKSSTVGEHQNPGDGSSDDHRDQGGVQQFEPVQRGQASAECVHGNRRRDVDSQDDDEHPRGRDKARTHVDQRGQHDGDDDGDGEGRNTQDGEGEERGVESLLQCLVVLGRVVAADERDGGTGKPQFEQFEIADNGGHEHPNAIFLVSQVPGEHRGRDQGHDDRHNGESEARQRVPAEPLRHVHRRHVAIASWFARRRFPCPPQALSACATSG